VSGEVLPRIADRAKALASGFAAYSAFGSFALYVLGYLALRFHLTTLGVGTDLAVLDERYLFAGAKFLVYAASTLPIAVLAAFVVAGMFYLPYRLFPSRARTAISGAWRRLLAAPSALATIGIVLALVFIQLVMRRCFYFANLLVAPSLPPGAGWLARLVLDDSLMPLYFSGLILATLLSGALLILSRLAGGDGPPAVGLRFKRGLLGVLVAIQALFLPVNYGVLVLDMTLARVSAPGAAHLGPGDAAWLVWEGKDGITFLIRRRGGARSLLTTPRADVKQTEITGYDRLAELVSAPPAPAMEAQGDADR
jgi:hypothetical protein